MDQARSIGAEGEPADDHAATREPGGTAAPVIGSDERRMHVRAYKFWVSLLGGRPFPPVEAFDPERLPDFGPHGVLLDFSHGSADAAIAYLGEALGAESGVAGPIDHISDVPGRSLLSRLTDQYLQIIANRAPIGFEAEFVNGRGNNTLYRGILLPFSSDGAAIDHVYGVINWKEMLDADAASPPAARVTAASVPGAAPTVSGPLWADGPAVRPGVIASKPRRSLASLDQADLAEAAAGDTPPADTVLADTLAGARATADLLHEAELRSRGALYRALGLAYDFLCAAERDPRRFAALLRDAGLGYRRRSPAAAAVKLVFGPDYAAVRRAEFVLLLGYGRRLGVEPGGMRRLLERSAEGIQPLIAAERAARRGG